MLFATVVFFASVSGVFCDSGQPTNRRSVREVFFATAVFFASVSGVFCNRGQPTTQWRCALPPEPPLPLFFFYTVMRTAAEDAVAVVILVEAGRLQN